MDMFLHVPYANICVFQRECCLVVSRAALIICQSLVVHEVVAQSVAASQRALTGCELHFHRCHQNTDFPATKQHPPSLQQLGLQGKEEDE